MSSNGTKAHSSKGDVGHQQEVAWSHRDTTARLADPENGITEETLAEWRKMVSGQVYNPGDPYISKQRRVISKVVTQVNAPEVTWDLKRIYELLKPHVSVKDDPGFFAVLTPFFMQFGHLNFERNVLVSPEAHFLDICQIHIGEDTMIGARATFVTGAHHPNADLRWPLGGMPTADGAPIYIGRRCWFGANVTVTQGVRIGDGVCIGAGSLVNKDIPSRCVAAGVPAKIIRWLEDDESMDEYIKRFERGDNGGKMGRMADGVPPPPSRQADAERWKRGEGRVWTEFGEPKNIA